MLTHEPHTTPDSSPLDEHMQEQVDALQQAFVAAKEVYLARARQYADASYDGDADEGAIRFDGLFSRASYDKWSDVKPATWQTAFTSLPNQDFGHVLLLGDPSQVHESVAAVLQNHARQSIQVSLPSGRQGAFATLVPEYKFHTLFVESGSTTRTFEATDEAGVKHTFAKEADASFTASYSATKDLQRVSIESVYYNENHTEAIEETRDWVAGPGGALFALTVKISDTRKEARLDPYITLYFKLRGWTVVNALAIGRNSLVPPATASSAHFLYIPRYAANTRTETASSASFRRQPDPTPSARKNEPNVNWVATPQDHVLHLPIGSALFTDLDQQELEEDTGITAADVTRCQQLTWPLNVSELRSRILRQCHEQARAAR